MYLGTSTRKHGSGVGTVCSSTVTYGYVGAIHPRRASMPRDAINTSGSMKNRNKYRLFLDTVNTIVLTGGTAFLIWWLWQLLPMMINYD